MAEKIFQTLSYPHQSTPRPPHSIQRERQPVQSNHLFTNSSNPLTKSDEKAHWKRLTSGSNGIVKHGKYQKCSSSRVNYTISSDCTDDSEARRVQRFSAAFGGRPKDRGSCHFGAVSKRRAQIGDTDRKNDFTRDSAPREKPIETPISEETLDIKLDDIFWPGLSPETIPSKPIKPLPRRRSTKSRRGCFNCKRRRISCNERHPDCGHCSKAGLQCEYPLGTIQYAQQSLASFGQPPAIDLHQNYTSIQGVRSPIITSRDISARATATETPEQAALRSPDQHPRKPIPRKGHTRSRRGCDPCKRRRIKCNEIRPECGHCIRAGLQCDYPANIIQTTRRLPALPQEPTIFSPRREILGNSRRDTPDLAGASEILKKANFTYPTYNSNSTMGNTRPSRPGHI